MNVSSCETISLTEGLDFFFFFFFFLRFLLQNAHFLPAFLVLNANIFLNQDLSLFPVMKQPKYSPRECSLQFLDCGVLTATAVTQRPPLGINVDLTFRRLAVSCTFGGRGRTGVAGVSGQSRAA